MVVSPDFNFMTYSYSVLNEKIKLSFQVRIFIKNDITYFIRFQTSITSCKDLRTVQILKPIHSASPERRKLTSFPGRVSQPQQCYSLGQEAGFLRCKNQEREKQRERVCVCEEQRAGK